MANDATTQSLTVPTGTDVVQMYADLQAQLAQIKLQAAGLQLTHDDNMAQIGQQANATAAQLQAAMANVAAQQQANAQRYDIDLKNYGLSVADLNYRQRQGQLQGQLQTIAEGVDVVRQRTETGMANYQQRQGQVNSNLQIADMLASRKGPQDFYAYNNLLNTLGGQTPGGGSTTVDPFQWTKNLVQPISDALPSWAANVNPDPSKINSPYTAQAGNAGATGGGGAYPTAGATGVTSPASSGSGSSSAMNYINSVLAPTPAAATPAAAPTGPTGYDISKVNKGWNLITLGSGGPVARSDFDPSITKVYGADAFDPTTGAPKAGATELQNAAAGQPVWVYHAAGGGLFGTNAQHHNRGVRVQSPKSKPQVQPVNSYMRKAKMAPMAAGGGKFPPAKAMPGGKKTIGPVVTGDSPSGAPTGHEELATVTTSDPNAKLDIQPANGGGLDMQSQGDPGTKAQGALAAIEQGIQALADAVAQLTGKSAAPGGSLLDAGNPMAGMMRAAGGMTVTPEMANQPDSYPVAKIDRSQLPAYLQNALPPANGNRIDDSGAGGRMGGNPAPAAQYGYMNGLPQNNNPSTGYGQFASTFDPTEMANMRQHYQRPPMPGPGGVGMGHGMGADGWQPGAGVSGNGSGLNIPAIHNMWQQAMQQWHGYPRFAGGGELTPGQPTNAGGGPDSWDYYGTGTQTPTLTYSSYTPEQLGSMPFLKKLFGGQATLPFQGLGSPIANPGIGIQPGSMNGSLLNLQRYNGLYDTEKQLTESLLGQGLGIDPNDYMQKSQAAAPVGATMGMAGYRR